MAEPQLTPTLDQVWSPPRDILGRGRLALYPFLPQFPPGYAGGYFEDAASALRSLSCKRSGVSPAESDGPVGYTVWQQDLNTDTAVFGIWRASWLYSLTARSKHWHSSLQSDGPVGYTVWQQDLIWRASWLYSLTARSKHWHSSLQSDGPVGYTVWQQDLNTDTAVFGRSVLFDREDKSWSPRAEIRVMSDRSVDKPDGH